MTMGLNATMKLAHEAPVVDRWVAKFGWPPRFPAPDPTG
jgi:hypothetical protein